MPFVCSFYAFVAQGQGVKKCFGQIKNKTRDKKVKAVAGVQAPATVILKFAVPVFF